MSVSNLIGLNAAFFSYCLLFRNLKNYVFLTFSFFTFLTARNLVSKNSLERIYLPIEPIYKEIRKHRSVTKDTPEGAKEIKEIKSIDDYVPVEERDDLTKEDKAKAKSQYDKRMKQSVNFEAAKEVEKENS